MSKQKSSRIEKHIYLEVRCGAFRFKVQVRHLKDSFTCDVKAEGLARARRLRVEFLEEIAGLSKPSEPYSPAHYLSQARPTSGPQDSLASIHLSDVFDEFESAELSKLAGKASEKSRLALLRKCFGRKTLDQLNEKLIGTWKLDRLSGKYGSGRPPNRVLALGVDENGKPLTKHQRYARRKKGKEFPSEVHPVSSQSVRHELNLLRRAITKYLRISPRWSSFGAQWQSHYLMHMELPEAAKPRSRRIANDELNDILSNISNPEAKAAVLLAVLTSLRRSEVLSLRWEDVDFKRSVVRLQAPGYGTKTKVHARDVPLLPGAIRLLQELKPQKFGSIFTISPGNFSSIWRQSADKADIFDVRLHDCRREALSRLVQDCGLNLPEAALFSGHQDLRTLEKHYIRLDASTTASRLAELPNAINLFPGT